ncbi:MAG: GHKL domain-containing protein [Nitrospirae bacterium]|nr:GHKL domain-containing protein [Nitrospirota bacterium]
MRILKAEHCSGIFKRELIYLIIAGLLSAVMLITTYIHAGKRFSEFLPLMDNFMIAKNAVAKAYLFSEKMAVSDETVSKEVVIGLINGAVLSVDDAINGRSAIAGTSAIRIADKELLRNLVALKNAVVKFRLVTEELMEESAQNRQKLRVDQRSAFYEIDFFASTSESTIRRLIDSSTKKQILFFTVTLVLWVVFAITLISMYLITRSRKEAEIVRLNAELEARVEQRTNELVTVNEELEAFAYSISHDLRAPLRAIDGFSKIILDDHSGRLDADGQRYFSLIRDSSKKMSELIGAVLDLSRLSRHDIKKEYVDMQSVAAGCYRDLLLNAGNRSITADIKIEHNAFCDKKLITQVFINLMSNAIKFTKNVEHALIEAGSSQDSKEIIFYVKDNGAGFDMQYVKKLFCVFQRLHQSEEFEGTGLGLAIVKRIITRHGGRVWAESSPGKGAVFYFSLPYDIHYSV